MSDNLEMINALRGKIRLAGTDEYLEPVTQEELDREEERARIAREKKQAELEEKRQELYKKIDGVRHKIKDACPDTENYEYDYSSDPVYNIDYDYSESTSYRVLVYPADKTREPFIGQYIDTQYGSQKSETWHCGSVRIPICEDDEWEYTKEAFDAGLK